MKENHSVKTKYNFFASANGYDGFMSYFDNVFASRAFTKIFVLKGGPGTGKSTIMKKIAAFAHENKYFHEVIYCSSDKSSLDGVIIENNGKRIAILDGTAPHERDAVIPGAVDELVNLGEAWKPSCLENEKSRIFDLNAKKAFSYKKAYDNLHISSFFARKAKAEISALFDFKKADESICLLCRELCCEGSGKRSIRLISSFSRDGYLTLDTLENISKKVIFVNGKFGSEHVYMNILRAHLQKTDTDYCMLPSPLDKNLTEAIFIEKSKTAIVSYEPASPDKIIDTLDFIDKVTLEETKDDFIDCSRIQNHYMKKAAQSLKKASDYHFELESIYTPSMDFMLLEEIVDALLSRCRSIIE